jgi:hypothetical protein
MKYQPNKNYKSDDVVMTPNDLAKQLVDYYKPQGRGLEPCRGISNIYNLLENADWCEISEGKDFFDYNTRVDYIFTNPPWSKIKTFLLHSMELANDIYFLVTVNHIFTKARLRLIKENGFNIKEILIMDTPKEFPQSGFQLGMIHISKSYKDPFIKFTHLNVRTE